jgi:hypothetical protein
MQQAAPLLERDGDRRTSSSMKNWILFIALVASGCAGPSLDVVVDGAHATWKQASLRSVPRVRAVGFRGHQQETWRLADLVHKFVGPDARAVAVVDEAGNRRPIRDADWADEKHVLVIGLGQKDFYKLERLFPDGSYEEPVAKGIESIEIRK